MTSHAKSPPLHRYLLALAILHATACATHTSSVVMRTGREPEPVCQTALDVMAEIAHGFGLRNAIPPGFEPSILTSGSIVLAQYRSHRGAQRALAGSDHNVYVTVFGREHCQEVSLAITDYESSIETAYVQQIRFALVAGVRERRPDAAIVVHETTTRSLPP